VTSNGGHGKRKEPPSDEAGNNRKKPSYLDIPNVLEVRREEWEKYKFTKISALRVVDSGEETGYDFYINLDNVYLQMEIKENLKIDVKLLEARFKYGMVLLGISLLDFDSKHQNSEEKISDENIGLSISEKISLFSEAIGPTLLPMIASLGDLELND